MHLPPPTGAANGAALQKMAEARLKTSFPPIPMPGADIAKELCGYDFYEQRRAREVAEIPAPATIWEHSIAEQAARLEIEPLVRAIRHGSMSFWRGLWPNPREKALLLREYSFRGYDRSAPFLS